MINHFIKHWRRALFHGNSLALLSFFGILAGLATSLIIAGFMLSIDLIHLMLQGHQRSDFSDFSPILRLILPIIGALLLILLYKSTQTKHHDVGIAHVIDRLQRGRGKLPLSNTVFQLGAAIIALSSGFSMGKEGPAVHIGSGIASNMGQQLGRPPSQLRLLTGCGTAAAISAAFGTPLAGVLFAMEVVLMEYSLNGFIPIIAASVVAAVSTQFFLGAHPALFEIDIITASTLEVPWLIVTGIATGIVGAMLHRLIKYFLTLNIVKMEYRFLVAGLITGLLGMLIPQVMGLGYAVMEAIMVGQFTFWILMAILTAKVFATAAAVGLGIPGGVVAPSLVIGMATGALVGYLAPGQANDSFYALLGMAGLMSALLHAPLAALTAVLELSLNAEMMFPAMIVVVLANLTCQVLFLQPSIFRTLLSNRGLKISTHPMRNALASRFLTEIASESFTVISATMDEEAIISSLAVPKRLLIFRQNAESYLVPRAKLNKRYLKWQDKKNKEGTDIHAYLAKAIPSRSRIAILTEDVSLLEGIRILQSDDVVGIQVPLDKFRIGLVTRSALSSVLTTEGDLN